MFLHASHIPVMVFLLAVGWVLGPTAGWALDSGEVAVIANEQVGDSLELADYYMQRRRIPPEHLIRLSVAANERC